MSISNNLSASRLIPSSDGTNIYAHANGNPTNPSLVFVHGISLSSVVFNDLLEDKRLLDHFYLVCYDLRGHGRSDRPTAAEAYGSKLWADDFAAVSESYGLKSPIFVGWSYGGSIPADICAHLAPGSLKAIIGIAPAPYPGITPMEFNTQESYTYYPGFLSCDDVLEHMKNKVAFVDACFNNPAEIPSGIRLAMAASVVSQSPEVTLQVFSRAQDHTALHAEAKAGLPLLVIYGTNDKLLHNEAIVSAVEKHFTKLDVHVIQGGSHTPFQENKDEVVEALVGFATKVFQS